MAIVLGIGLRPEEIRVLQEFRRRTTETLTLEQVIGIRHPADGGEAPARTLVEKGYVTADAESFTITEKGKEFLAIDARPEVPETAPSTSAAASDPKAGGV